MLRWAWAIYMVLVTAAGPGLCCCSLQHLFARHTDQQTTAPALPACCHHGSGGEQDEGQGGCPREKGDPKKPGCPCRDQAPKPALVDRAFDTPDQSQAGSFSLEAYLAVAFDGNLAFIGGHALPGCPLPFVTAHDLLHAHRQLRC